MEKVNKLTTITRAFTQESTIDEKILENRREICFGCEFNSINVPQEKLTFIDKARKKTLGENNPFCTACGCQIKEKTAQETEECGAVSKGIPAKWFRVKLETVDKLDLNFINKSVDLVNLDLDKRGRYYGIYFGNTSNTVKLVKILIESKIGTTFDIDYINPSCNSCTEVEFKKINDNTYEVDIELNLPIINANSFTKNIYFAYNINKETKRGVIKLIGTKN